VLRCTPGVLAVGFWLWSASIAAGAGFIGTLLNCDGAFSCKTSSPPWLEPWVWGEYEVFPEATIVAAAALIPASAFVAFVITRRELKAAAALVLSVALLSYAYFGGLTPEGRAVFWFGPLLGVAALIILRRLPARSASPIAPS
jgi:hypothetical protein